MAENCCVEGGESGLCCCVSRCDIKCTDRAGGLACIALAIQREVTIFAGCAVPSGRSRTVQAVCSCASCDQGADGSGSRFIAKQAGVAGCGGCSAAVAPSSAGGADRVDGDISGGTGHAGDNSSSDGAASIGAATGAGLTDSPRCVQIESSGTGSTSCVVVAVHALLYDAGAESTDASDGEVGGSTFSAGVSIGAVHTVGEAGTGCAGGRARKVVSGITGQTFRAINFAGCTIGYRTGTGGSCIGCSNVVAGRCLGADSLHCALQAPRADPRTG